VPSGRLDPSDQVSYILHHFSAPPQDLLGKISQFSRVSISAPTAAQLSASDQRVLGLLVRAARLLDPVYNRSPLYTLSLFVLQAGDGRLQCPEGEAVRRQADIL
jgi:hypothetical protein